MPTKQADPFADIRQMLGGVQVGQPNTLLDFANQNHYRVTSGFQHGGHNPGSLHYQGSPTDPGAIDIDNRGVNLGRLITLAKQNGFNVHDETSRPAGQQVWTGPHYHVSKGGQSKPQAASPQPQASQQSFSPVSFTTDKWGNVVPQNAPTFSAKQAQAASQVKVPQVSTVTSPPKTSTQHSSDFNDIRTMLSQVGTQPAQKPETSFLGDLGTNFNNALHLYPQDMDQSVQQAGHGVGAALGNIAGSLPLIVGSGLVANLPGAIAAGAGLGVNQNLQQQRMQGAGGLLQPGKHYDIGQALGTGAIQGAMQALPGSNIANPLLRLGANIGIQGGGAALGDVGQQLIEGKNLGNIDLARVLQSGELGAAGGVATHILHGTPKPTDIALKQTSHGNLSKPDTPVSEASVIQDLAIKERHAKETAALQAEANKPIKTEADVISRLNAQKQLEALPAKHAQEIQTLQERPAVKAKLQEEMAAYKSPAELQQPTETVNPTELSQSYKERVYGKPEIITPGQEAPAAANDLLGSAKIENAGPIDIATRATDKPPTPDIQIELGLPQGEKVDINPGLKTETVIDPATGRPYKPIDRQLRSSRDLALERANEIANRPDAEPLASGNERVPERLGLPPSGGKEIIRSPYEIGKPTEGIDIARPGDRTPTGQLTDANGRPLDLAKPPEKVSSPTPGEKPPSAAGETQTSPAVAPKEKGAFIDTINELLKDKGLDYSGVKQLKQDIETRKSLLDGTLKGSRTEEAKRLRAELKGLRERWKGLDPNIQELAGHQFDASTGEGSQSHAEGALRYDQVESYLNTDNGRKTAQQYAKAMSNKTQLDERYVAEHSGRSREAANLGAGGRVHVAKTSFSPTHFTLRDVTYPGGPRRVVVAHGYNQRGHLAERYIEPSPKGSHVQQVLKVSDRPAFQGPTASIYDKPRQFRASDLLARGARTERGFIKTSEAIRAIHEQKKALLDIANNSKLPTESKSKLSDVLNGKSLSYDDINNLRKVMSVPEKLADFCSNMGLR